MTFLLTLAVGAANHKKNSSSTSVRPGPQFFTNFHQILDATRIDAYYSWGKPEVFSDFRGVRIQVFAVSSSGQNIFQRIGTEFPTELKLSNADFVLSGKWDRKYKSDFRDVQTSVSVFISALWNDYDHSSLLIFTKFCMRLRNWDKLEVVFQFQRCADSDFGSFQALVTTFFNRSAPSPIYR